MWLLLLLLWLLLSWLQARLPKRRLGGGGLGGLTCAILKLERSCLHHRRGLGARGRHAPLVGVHIILKDDSGGIGLVVVGSPHQGVLHHPIFELGDTCVCSLLCVAFLGARGLLLILCFNRKFTRDTARVCCCCCCDVVCCGESRSQRHLFSNTRGSHSACVVALSYVRTHDQNTNSPESLGGGCSARTALARSTASCKSPGILVFCVLCSSLRVFVLVP